MSDAPVAFVYIGAFLGLTGGGIAVFNAWKAVQWKRAELANSYLKDLASNQVLVFASRALDWNGGRLVVPEDLRPLLPDKSEVIDHEPAVLERAMSCDLFLSDLKLDPRLQLYRTAMDDFLSWLGLVSNALGRNLFDVTDIREVGYWVFRIEQLRYIDPFITAYGYRQQIDRMRWKYARFSDDYRYTALRPTDTEASS